MCFNLFWREEETSDVTGSRERLLTAIEDAFSDVVKPESDIFLPIKDRLGDECLLI